MGLPRFWKIIQKHRKSVASPSLTESRCIFITDWLSCKFTPTNLEILQVGACFDPAQDALLVRNVQTAEVFLCQQRVFAEDARVIKPCRLPEPLRHETRRAICK